MVKPVFRRKSIGTKVSEEEYARLEALAGGRAMSEWVREVLLERMEGRKPTVIEETNTSGTMQRDYVFGVYPEQSRRTRNYNPRLGRFMSADPLAGSISNPQSLNRYSYVINNPESYVDPSGMTLPNPSLWGELQCDAWDSSPYCQSYSGSLDGIGWIGETLVFTLPQAYCEAISEGLWNCGWDSGLAYAWGLTSGPTAAGPRTSPTPQTQGPPPNQRSQPPPQPQPTPQQSPCSAAVQLTQALGASAGINALGAVFTAEIPPFAAIFGGIAAVEGIGSGVVGIYAAYVCFQE